MSDDLQAGPGETEVIALAIEVFGVLLTDDERAAKLARNRGVPTFGTLGVLQRAHARSMADIDTVLRSLGRTNYRHTDALFERVRRAAHAMRATTPPKGSP